MKKILITYGLLIIQAFIAVSIALFPRVYNDALIMQPNAPTPRGYYIFTGIILLGVAVQATEKEWSRRKDLGRLQNLGFFKKYAQLVATAIGTLQDLSEYGPEDLATVQRNVLTVVCDVVCLYYGNREGLVVSANAMRREHVRDHSKDGRFTEEVRFADPMRSPETYKAVLTIVACDTNAGTDFTNFSLPIDSDKDRLLFGAPKAYENRDIQTVSDTNDRNFMSELVSNQPVCVQNAIFDYFRSGDAFRSFLSRPLICGSTVVGVLNIHSNRCGIIGTNKKLEKDLDYCLEPLCTILANIMARELVIRRGPKGEAKEGDPNVGNEEHVKRQ